jgi:Ser-tRNA(Ala) deacylase AlaX
LGNRVGGHWYALISYVRLIDPAAKGSSVIFPEGGGQPPDYGTLTLQSPYAQSVVIVDAFRRQLDAVHVVRFSASTDPTTNGWRVGAQVHVEVDWDRRIYRKSQFFFFSHHLFLDLNCFPDMQQHTGQHVLSAVFEHELNFKTVGWQLSQSTQPSYVDLERAPTDDDVSFVVRRCNEVIQATTSVRISLQLESDHERPDTLPEDYRDGVVRYVTIDGLDRNPCCGTHFPSLAFLGSIFIFPGFARISGPTRFRIFFVVGNAVLQQISMAHSIIKDVGSILDCGASAVPERVGQLHKARKDGLARERALKAEACRALALDLVSSLRDINGIQIGHLHREEEGTDIEFLNAILNAFRPSQTTTKWLVTLSGGAFSNGNGGCLVVASSEEALVAKAAELVRTQFQGRVKGGGKGRWQGKVLGNWERGDRKLLSQIIQDAASGSMKL